MRRLAALVMLIIAFLHEFFGHGDEKQPHVHDDYDPRAVVLQHGGPFPQVLYGNPASVTVTATTGSLTVGSTV